MLMNRSMRPLRLQRYIVVVAMVLVELAHGDTIKLKDGSTLEGRILSEDNAQIVMEVHYASGSITKTETFAKANVVEVKRGGNEDSAKRQMAVAYDEVRKLQLNYDASFPLAQYDQMIPKLKDFVMKYPDHPDAKQVRDNLSAWLNERAQVAAGKIKYHGEWMDAAVGTTLLNRDRAQKLMEAGRSLLAQGKYQEAIQQMDALQKLNGTAEMTADAMAIRTEAVTKLTKTLEQSRNKITDKISEEEGRLTTAQEELTKSETDLDEWKKERVEIAKQEALDKQANQRYGYYYDYYSGYSYRYGYRRRSTTSGEVKRLGEGTEKTDGTAYQARVAKAHADVTQIQARVDSLKKQLSQIESRIAEIQAN